MVNDIVWQGLFGGRFEDRQHALQVFQENSERARRVVDPERLLLFEPKDGWKPLCDFLGVPVSETPFPHLNEAASIRRLRRVVGVLRWAPVGVAVALAFAAFLIASG